MTQGIYEIVNLADGKASAYIGSSVDVSARWNGHRSQLRRGQHVNAHLQHAWNLYGEDAFVFSVLKEVEDADMLLAMEQEYLDNYLDWEHCYNIAQEAAAPMMGHPHTEATRCKISEAHKGKKFTEEHRYKLSEAHKGKVFSEEHRRKISEAHKGMAPSEETRQKMSEALMGNQHLLGHRHTEETKRKMSESHKGNQYNLGRKHTDEARRKISEAQTGHMVSEETKRKISEANKGRKHTEEHKRKLSEAAKRYHRGRVRSE